MDSSTRLPGQYAAPNTQSLFLMLVNLKIYQQKWHKYSSDFLGGGFFFFFYDISLPVVSFRGHKALVTTQAYQDFFFA